MIDFRVLGSLDLRGPGGEEILSVLSQPKRVALLAYLAVARPPGFHRRDKLVGLFWPEVDQSRARNSLSQSLRFLRLSLGEETIRTRGGEEVGLDYERIQVDALAFREALRVSDFAEALDLYQGPFLEGFFLSGCSEFERWVEEERDTFREAAATGAWGLARSRIAEGCLTEAERVGQRALGLVSTDENEVRRFIEALAGAGDRAAAVRFYERFAQGLREELDLEPSAETRAVAIRIREGRESGRATGATAPRPAELTDRVPEPLSAQPSPGPPAAFPESGLKSARHGELWQWTVVGLAGAWFLMQAAGAAAERLGWVPALTQGITLLAALGLSAPLLLALHHGRKELPRAGGVELLLLALLLVTGGGALSSFYRNGDGSPVDTRGDRPVIALLPIEDLGRGTRNAPVASGIREELLRRLGLIRGLTVVSAPAAVSLPDGGKGFRGMAEELGAHHLVDGNAQAVEGRVRTQFRLIDGKSGLVVWTQSFDGTLGDILDFLGSVTDAIASELGVPLTAAERARIEALPTANLVARGLYLRSAELEDELRDENATAIELLRQATLLDPEFGLAHARMAWRFHFQGMLHGQTGWDSAKVHAQRALELDPELPDAHTALGFGLGFDGGPSYRKAVEINPSHGMAWALLGALGWFTGDHVRGAVAARRGVQVAPGEPEPAYHLGHCLGLVGMYDEATAWFQRAVAADPRGFRFAEVSLIGVHLWRGDLPGAKRHEQSMLELGRDNLLGLYVAAFVDLAAGDAESAQAKLSQVVRVNRRYTANGLPTAEALLGWVRMELGVPGAEAPLEDLRRVRLEEVDQLSEGHATSRPAEIPHSIALGLAGRYNDLSVIASAFGEVEEQAQWFLKAGSIDRMNLFYNLLRLTPWVAQISHRADVRAWMRDKERQMAAQRRELDALGSWKPGGEGPSSP